MSTDAEMNAEIEPVLELEATHLALREIGPWLRSTIEGSGRVDHPSLGVIELAVHELATNSVDHAGSPDGRLRLEAAIADDALTVYLVDRGQAFEFGSAVVPEEPQVRGYGMMIIEQVSETLAYERLADSNRWTASFAL